MHCVIFFFSHIYGFGSFQFLLFPFLSFLFNTFYFYSFLSSLSCPFFLHFFVSEQLSFRASVLIRVGCVFFFFSAIVVVVFFY